jgi:RNA polymerase sigma-70 factor (ECF subfamily)
VESLPSTLWSQVLAAGQGAAGALENLAKLYLGPVYAHVRASGRSREDAEDLTQDFFAFLLESHAIGKADPRRGRFRAFLFTCLSNFLANDADRRRALKRGGDRVKLSIDVEGAERVLGLGTEADPQRRFDRHWALETMSRALSRLKDELAPAAAEAFALAHDGEPVPHAEIARRLGMTDDAVAQSVHRARRRLREILVEEVRATVGEDGDVAEELGELLRALSASGDAPHGL